MTEIGVRFYKAAWRYGVVCWKKDVEVVKIESDDVDLLFRMIRIWFDEYKECLEG